MGGGGWGGMGLFTFFICRLCNAHIKAACCCAAENIAIRIHVLSLCKKKQHDQGTPSVTQHVAFVEFSSLPLHSIKT